MSLLSAHELAFEYPGPVRALDGVEFALEPGELVGVLGPNGSGKSTLVALLAGLLRPTRGRTLLGDRPLERVAPRERAREVAVVPQYLPQLPDVTVDNFVLGGRYAHYGRWAGAGLRDREAVRESLLAADVGELGGRLMGELSGGQRQRVLLARAMAQEARALLIDEPTSSLDPGHQIQVFELIARVVAAGRGALVVTHDLNLAAQYASRVVLLDAGRVAAEGPVDLVLRREVLEPVYGPHLHYGRLRAADGSERPFVLPWSAAAAPAGEER